MESTTVAGLLNELITLFTQSNFAYRNYLAGGKTFRFAQELKLFNSAALRLLKERLNEFPLPLQSSAEALIGHYSAWSAKWDELAATKSFQPDDIFVFENDQTFPHEAARTLEAEHERLNPPPATPAAG